MEVPINIRLQKYKKNRIVGMNQYNAARAAGYSHYTAKKSNRLEKGVKGGIADALEQIGLTDQALAKHAKEGLHASKVISANITYGDADEKTNDFIDVPDWGNRHKYLNTICELTSRIKHKIEHSGLPQSETKIIIVREKDGSKSNTERIPESLSL